MSKKRTFTIGFLLKLCSLIALVSMLSIIICMGVISDNSLKSQSAKINKSTLAFYIDKLDQSLQNLDMYLYNFIYNNSDAKLMKLENSEQERYKAKMEISDSLSQIVTLHSMADGVLFYSPLGSEAEFITRTSQVLSSSESNALQERVLQIINEFQENNRLGNSKWFVDHIGGKSYFLRIIFVDESYCGAWISAESLLNSLSEIDFGEGGYPLLCSLGGELLVGSEIQSPIQLDYNNWQVLKTENKQYIQVSMESNQCEFAVSAIIPVEGIFSGWHNGLQIVILFAFMFLIILIVILFGSNFLYRHFSVLESAMKKVEQGDFEIQINKKTRITDYINSYNIFNSMVLEIKNLKISIYERQLSEQKIMRQYLQIQLKSHFYLNCLNIIYSLAEVKDYLMIQKLTLCLVKYFRYMMNDSGKMACLKNEIEHIQNYMEIQELRFPDMISFHIDIDDECMDAMIMPLMIQTFIENSIEHAMDFEQHNYIYLTVKKEKRNNINGISVIIEDNGTGFNHESLERINKNNSISKTKSGKGIGINNIISRLKILYNGKAKIEFSNTEPHGAVVRIWMPELGKDE